MMKEMQKHEVRDTPLHAIESAKIHGCVRTRAATKDGAKAIAEELEEAWKDGYVETQEMPTYIAVRGYETDGAPTTMPLKRWQIDIEAEETMD